MIFTDLAKAAYPAPNTEGETVEYGDCRVRRNSSRPSSVMLVRGYVWLGLANDFGPDSGTESRL
jgi:hypothetical protein